MGNKVKRVSLLGVGVHLVDLDSTLDVMADSISNNRRGYVCLAPAHSLMATRSSLRLREIFNQSALTVPDGMGTVWFLRLLGYKSSRVYGPDLMLAACERGQAQGWKHFYLGGSPSLTAKLVSKLRDRFPQLQVAGSYEPPFRQMDDDEIKEMVYAINQSDADILWVALGSPKQELWMAEFRPRLNVPLMVGVGAAFDFLSGVKPQAPAWMQRSGMEWLFRVITEPRRLWRRYASYPIFVLLALAQVIGLRKYPLEEKV